jgi:hypothetical protein
MGLDTVKLLILIYLPGKYRKHEYQPDIQIPHQTDGIQYRLKFAVAGFAVKILPKRFKIHIGPIQVRVNGFDRFWPRIPA